ncbi:hypothetical protein P691DRAFT_774260 [Macrolepiota fuliginosa MF-IS2]|uniref:Uncharacterized protein n=1 Tax=Macrolepiota fuliginosa MF-IS2 TaxID=1400762 RepID=A0A9P5XHV9_9AGAR|nr:hypothetical protein P691DRAFT_774260 [Macrolepiota fuliginosa MF-IS2]
MIFSKGLLAALLSITFVSALPGIPAPTGLPTSAADGDTCHFIWGTIPCSNPYSVCCIPPGTADFGYCTPHCPEGFSGPVPTENDDAAAAA